MKKISLLLPFIFILGCTEAQSVPLTTVSLTHARSLVGLHERQDTSRLKDLLGVNPIHTQWCAAFVNSILHMQDIKGSESVSEHPLTARSFLDWGEPVDVPQYGDVVVFPRGSQGWQGHVGFYLKTQQINGIDYYIILGGNQNNSVSYELYPAYRAIGIRRAIFLAHDTSYNHASVTYS